MFGLSFILSLFLVISVFGRETSYLVYSLAQSTPLLTVLSTTAGDYTAVVSAKLNQNGLIYVYPLPVQVNIAPDDATITSYGFSANVTAGETATVIVRELQASSSYNLYITGRSMIGVISSPSRIVKVITTSAPVPPTLVMSGFVSNKESVVLKYTLSSDGTIWCHAYTTEDREYASVEGVYSSIQGSPAVAHVLSNYFIGNLEPNMDYYTFCVAENSRQIPMNTQFASTELHVTTLAEPPYISYLGNTVTYNTVTLSAITNVRSDVYNYTVIRTPDYSYPSIQLLKSSRPTRSPRQVSFTMSWQGLQNATEYALSLYSEDHKGLPTQQSVTSTTFFVTTDIVRCQAETIWPITAAGKDAEASCELGYHGKRLRRCGYDGQWESVRSSCERTTCPAAGVWNLTLSLTEVSMSCGAGFTGTMTRYCNANGVWETADRSRCQQIYCPAADPWPSTPALTTAQLSCGIGFFGTQTRFCNAMGDWETASVNNCVEKKLCPTEGVWQAVYEGDSYVIDCAAGYDGTISRLCALGGEWTDPMDSCIRRMCPENSIWPETPSNTTALFACPLGESGFITRFCSIEGVWAPTNTSACQQIFCPQEGVWEGTLAGLTIPGPCQTGKFGQSARTCSVTGAWSPVDYSDCYDMGCLSEDGWSESPIKTTLMRKCPAGYTGYQYRFCSEQGHWASVDDSDCNRLFCLAMAGFDRTPSGTQVTVPCGEHFHGEMSGFCALYGAWTQVDVSACVAIPTCPEDGIWPETNIASLRTLSCGVGIQGSRTRYCGADGIWGIANESSCVQLYCPSQGDWPRTIAGITAYKSCQDDQFGFIRRSCSVSGEWGPVIDDYCYTVWCASYEGWPATGGGVNATMACSSGYQGSQTRLCTGHGNWGDVDDSQCVVTTCPADGVWPETLHSTSRLPLDCGMGYTGTMYRDCSLQGDWSTVDNSLCIRKRCLPSGDWPLTLSLTNVSRPCPSGYSGSIDRYCGDGVWDEPLFNCETLMCPKEDGWIGAAGLTITRDCPYGYRGTRTRRCSVQGEWEQADESKCVEIRCPAFDGWEEGGVGSVQIKPCDQGFAILTCGADGAWEGNPTMCYTNLCPVDGMWPYTAPGSTRYGSCPIGYEGTASRYCSATGVWATVNVSKCYQLTCPVNDIWPETPRNKIATTICPSHMTGQQTRPCLMDSTWGTIDQSKCTAHSCPVDDIWPQTKIDTQLTLACGIGQRGFKTRRCESGGIWSIVNDNSCSQIVCFKDSLWPTTNALETARKPCPDGFLGSIDRMCSAIGVWETEVNRCYERSCPAESPWPETIINKKATITCPIGYSGTYSRACSNDGLWLQPDMSTCTRLHCNADGIWPATNTLTNATRPCLGNQLGEITRYCNVDKIWHEPNSANCRPNYCPAENDWSDTQRNHTVSRACPQGYHGVQYRTCRNDALWLPADQTQCKVVPFHSHLSFVPHSYFFTVNILLNIDSTVFFVARLSGAIAPSLQQLLSSSNNATCLGQQMCKAFVRSLRPETEYDVYYWYRSSEGVDATTLINTMKVRMMTMEIVPFVLSVEDVQGEFTEIMVLVSMEQRGGYVWCRETDTLTTPLIDWLKLSDPLVLQDGEERGIRIIPNLLSSTSYYVFCYAQDFYGDSSTLSIANSMRYVTTTAERAIWSSELETTYLNATLTVITNRNATLCCVWSLESMIVSSEDVMREGQCDLINAITENEVMTMIEEDEDYWVYCALHTTTLLTFFSPQPLYIFHSPARSPSLTYQSTTSTYQSLLLTFISDRPSFIWCISTFPSSSRPPLNDIKMTPRVTAIRDEPTEVIITGLSLTTNYRVYCWAESFEGLPTSTPLSDLVFDTATLSLPPTLTVYSFTTTHDTVRLMIGVTVDSLVQCLIQSPTSSPPTLASFADVSSVSISQLGEVEVSGLTENTAYIAYCLARDQYNQHMLNTIDSTSTSFTTPFNRHLIFVELLRQQQLTVTLSLLASDQVTVWCSALHTNEIPPSAEILQTDGVAVSLEMGIDMAINIPNLRANYPYSAYCTSMSNRNMTQENSIASTRTQFRTADYPLLSLILTALPSNPSHNRLDVDVTVSTLSQLFCRPRLIVNNELPPTNEWIEEGQRFNVTQSGMPIYVTLAGLMPSSAYHLYCIAVTQDGLTSLQSLADRSLSFTTLIDVTGPLIFFSDDSVGINLLNQPVALNITFNENIIELNEDDLILINCQILSFLRYSNTLYHIFIAPLSHGILSLTVPANTIKDLYNNNNEMVSWTKIYPEGILTLTVHSKGALFADLALLYRYQATAVCAATTNHQAPSSCSALAALPGAATGLIDNGSGLVRINQLAVNTTFYAYCCVEEMNNVTMTNTLQSTRTVIELGWLECPIISDTVCNGQGSCLDGHSCMCNSGFYGATCMNSCPGILLGNHEIDTKECNGHGTCNAITLQCICSDSMFGTDSCSFIQLIANKPEDGHVFVYATLSITVASQTTHSFLLQEQQIALLTSLADAIQITSSSTAIREWSFTPSPTRSMSGTVTSIVLIDIESSRSDSTMTYFKTNNNMKNLSTELTEKGYENSGIISQNVFSVGSSQTDPYTCYDGKKSSTESDVDCGGECGRKCEYKQQCVTDYDCISEKCTETGCAFAMTAGLIVLIVVLSIIVVVGILIIVFIIYRHNKKKRENEQKVKEIELVKQKETVILKDLEKQDQAEEEEMKRLELEAEEKKRQRREERKEKKRNAGLGEAKVNSMHSSAISSPREAENLPIPALSCDSSDEVNEVNEH